MIVAKASTDCSMRDIEHHSSVWCASLGSPGPRITAGGPPAVILGPGEPKLAHQTDEWCSMARIEQSVDAFATIMRRWCGV